MAIEEREPANSEANVSRIHDDDGVFLSGEEEDEILDNNLPSTQAEQRRAQKAVFESWLQTEAAQQPMRRTKQHETEEPEDEYLSIKALMAKQESAEIVKNPREYQLELFERAKKENTIAVLDTGSGKTLIAVLLIRWMIDQELELRASGKPHRVTFFLVASVALMFQQHAVLEANLDHKIARFCGAMNVHKWTKDVWCQHFSENKVVVCTADVLLQCLSHSFITMKQINLLVFDEAHHAKKDHAYATIIKDYYKAETTQNARPRIFGMTASPVDSKAEVYQSAMDLETVLHSRIATATDLSFQEILKKNDERILPYAPKRPAFETELLRATKARFFHVKVLQQTFDTAKDVAAELGCWCADQYLASALAEQNLRKYESRLKRDARKCSTARSESDIDKEMAEVRQASEFVAAQWNCGQINRDDLSDKVKQLTVFLSEEFQRPSDYRCLVFVDQRKVARLLFELFKRQGYEHLRPGLLVGADNKDLDEMTSCRQQVLTITQFRKGDINCLFATSVAEEGLDVPDCNLVIRFSLYTNMVQYIQSRGRARQANSRFIHMVEIGNHKEADLLREVRYSELRMKSFCQALPEDRRIQGNQDAHEKLMKKESALKVHTLPTEAKLTFGNALGILANFVSAVPTDSDEPQHPTYVVTGPAGNFTAEVLLPPGAPFRSQIGESQTRRSLAKRSAAFEACHALLRKKYLNDYLLPVYAKKLPAMRNAHLAVNSKKTLTYNMMVKPLIWEQSRGKLPGELFITVVQFPDGLGRDCQPFAMLSRTPMPRFPAFPVFLRDDKGSRVATCPIEKALPVNEHTLTLLTSFTLRVFKDVFSKTYENNVSQMSYWLAPVNDAQAVDCAPFDLLDWRLMQEVFEHEQYIWTAGMPDAALLNRFFVDKWDGGRKLYSKSVSQTLKPLDPVPAGTAKGKWKANILDYSNTMFKKTREKFKDTWDLSQPVIEMETALARRNVLVVPNLKEANEPTQAFVCPQPLYISVLPPRMAVSLFVWPSIIWRLESFLIALEACSVVGVQCDPAMALAAITKDSDNSGDHDAEERINFQHGMGENYERLEFLGDCFLKTATTLSTFVQLPGENEFKMHVARMVMLCNRNLFKVAKGLKLYEFIRSRAFSRRLWYPEGLKLLEGKGAQKTEETEEEMRMGSMHNLAEKTIADVCEAMIGAAFLSHNQPGNWHPDHWKNAIRTVTKLVASDNHKMLTWNDYRAAYRPPEYEIADVTASQRDMADKVEQEHNYHFQDPRLLRSAFIHPSQPFLYEKLPNYQRLEFLGDALLDQASITYLFYKFPDKDPQWLTEHKMAMIGNRALGMVAATTGFHKHIRHCHATVEQQIRDYVTDLQDAKEAAGPNVADYWTAVSDPPKCLADIVEAYIGAVFIDSGFDYNEVQRFFDMHIKPHFEDMSLYDGYANNHPCTHLHHVLDQTYGCQQYRIIAKQVPMLGAFDSKGVVVAVMIHNEVFAHDMGQSVRYARVRVAKTALEKLEGLGLADFRARFMCQCSKDVQADGAADGVHADCGI